MHIGHAFTSILGCFKSDSDLHFTIGVCVTQHMHAGSEFGLHSLPKEVLLRIFGLAAFPLGMWMTGLPQVKITEGLPEKPLALETLQEQHHASKS